MTSDDVPPAVRTRRAPPPFRRVRVRSTSLLSPRMLRMVLTGDELDGFVIPSPAFGPGAELLHDSLGSIDIPVRLLDTAQDLLFELVCKNIYILTTNIAGLEIGGTVGNLWSEHRSLAEQVAGEVIQLQEKLTGQHLDHGRLISAMLEAFDGDPEHECMGRSAPARLQRALQLAASFGLQLATLRGIQQRQMTS